MLTINLSIANKSLYDKSKSCPALLCKQNNRSYEDTLDAQNGLIDGKNFLYAYHSNLLDNKNVSFAGSEEMSDDEFIKRLSDIEARLKQKNIPQNIIDELLYKSNISKENINLAEVLLFDKTVDTNYLDLSKTLLFTDNNNEEFAIELCRNKNYPRNYIPDTLLFITENTIPLAKQLLDLNCLHKNEIYTSLVDFTEDPVTGIATICNNTYNRFYNNTFPNELKSVFSDYADMDTINYMKGIYESTYLTEKEIHNIFANMTSHGLTVFSWLHDKKHQDSFSIIQTLETIKNYSKHFSDEEIYNLIYRVEYQKKLVAKNPDNYTNSGPGAGLYVTRGNRISTSNNSAITEIFGAKYGEIMLLASLFDKESMDVLFRKRCFELNNTLKKIKAMNPESLKLLKEIQKCKRPDGKKFTSRQKIDFIDIIRAYNSFQLNTGILKQMIKNGTADVNVLQEDILKQVIKNVTGCSEKKIAAIPKEKLMSWDLKYIHGISTELIDSTVNQKFLTDTIKAATFGNFQEYITDYRNIYGESNLVTAKLFDMYGINYKKWINPSKANNVQFKETDKNEEDLEQLAAHITEDIETLRNIKPEVKTFIDKRFPHLIENDKVRIPKQYTKQRRKMDSLLSNLHNNLKEVWDRADRTLKNNSSENASGLPIAIINQDIQRALTVKTIKDHFEQELAYVKSIPDTKQKSIKSINYTIKMWDRNPQKDLFQGNYSTCCIGMGRSNGQAMPTYLLNTAFNMIEIVDNNTGETIGNALCYFTSDETSKPIFVIDNIEINNAVKPSSNTGIKLRNAILQYARNLTEDLTGNSDIKIILGISNNDLPASDLENESTKLNLIGNAVQNKLYLDLFGGWIDRDKMPTVRQYKILTSSV